MRVDNWPIKLAAEIEAANQRLFVWGEHDCCQFVARVGKAITGVDRSIGFSAYTSMEEAVSMVESYGGFIAMLTSVFGESKHPAFAHRGDVVLCEFGNGPQPAICLGVWCVAPDAKGLAKRMTDDATHAWTVD